MRRLLLVAVAASAALFAPSTAALACDGQGYIDGAGLVYVTNDANWIYIETNGQSGLQRGQHGMFDSTDYYSAADCEDSSPPDSKIY